MTVINITLPPNIMDGSGFSSANETPSADPRKAAENKGVMLNRVGQRPALNNNIPGIYTSI